MRKLVGVGVLAVLAVACGDELAEGAGDILSDAGQILSDAGAALSDAGSDVVSAQEDAGATNKPSAPTVESYDVKCDQKFTRVVVSKPQFEGGPTSTTTRTNYYAVVNIDTQNVVGVDARRCGHKVFGIELKPEYCADAISCEGTANAPIADCDVTSSADFLPTQVRVSCGQETQSAYSDGTGGGSGNTFETATVTVQRR